MERFSRRKIRNGPSGHLFMYDKADLTLFKRTNRHTNRLVMELFSRRTGRLESVQVVGCCVYDKPI